MHRNKCTCAEINGCVLGESWHYVRLRGCVHAILHFAKYALSIVVIGCLSDACGNWDQCNIFFC